MRLKFAVCLLAVIALVLGVRNANASSIALFVSDGTSAISAQEHQATLDILAQSFADVVTTEEVLKDIYGRNED